MNKVVNMQLFIHFHDDFLRINPQKSKGHGARCGS
jgi:hypothetical protein